MSMDEHDVAYERYMSDLYEEHYHEAIEEFTDELLISYYTDNKLLAKPAINSLCEARKLEGANPTAVFILAAIAVEVGLKVTLLKPIIFGLVHDNSVASLITDLTVSHPAMKKYQQLLLRVLDQHGGVNIEKIIREGSDKTLWDEIKEVKELRNLIMHRAEKASIANADLALGVASTILEKVFPDVVAKMGLHLHNDFQICDDFKCKLKSAQDK
ncbi:hypothetical protein MNBD_NITROSPINAE03-1526 [hydrothermal vent metagenome]|uniref:RiboL-PSP-HEPN domain-containing protein n=1 Tax=hydrothermal vent metagenome TaxID=652676 RepID=A0A3B1CCA1_9ZZZZ